MGGVQSDVCAWRLEQRPAILENVAPVSLMSRDEPSGLSIDTLGMSRVAGAGVGAAEDGATNAAGRVSPVRSESVMALLLWRPIRVAGRFARGESVMASPPWRVAGGAGGSGAMIFRCDGDGGDSVIAEAMFVCGGTFGRVWPAMRARGRFYALYCMLSIFAI